MKPIDPVFAERRRRVLAALGPDGAMILAAAPEIRVGRDLDLRYRPDPDLFYLTGLTEPEVVAVLNPTNDESPFTLFVRPRDPDQERWTGYRPDAEAVQAATGADAVFPNTELTERLPRLLEGVSTLHFRLDNGRSKLERTVLKTLVRGRHARQRSGRGAVRIQDPGLILDELRLIKDAGEIAAIRRAAAVTVEAVREAVATIRPGAGEWEVEAAVESGFRRRGAWGPAFATIVAAGPNATVLHYIQNGRTMAAGELLLIDAGAYVDGYTGDISRTFPVSGRFSAIQRSLYEAVLAAHDAAIAAVRPGARFADAHRAALRVLVTAMRDHGLVQGEVNEILEDEKRYKAFYPHRTSHWLGLDVHDVGDYVVEGESRLLEPGMVLTIEPGLYIPSENEDAPETLRGIGIRLEDDILVTDDGAEVLTSSMPILPDDVEALLAG